MSGNEEQNRSSKRSPKRSKEMVIPRAQAQSDSLESPAPSASAAEPQASLSDSRSATSSETAPEGATSPHAQPHEDDQPIRSYPGTSSDSRIRYLNGKPLTRPITLPKSDYKGLFILVAIAVAIGAIFLFWYLDATINGPAYEKERVEQEARRDVAMNLPVLSALAPLDDQQILSSLQANGDTIFDATTIKNSTSSLEIVRLPPNVSVADAGMMYVRGIKNLSASEATNLLNGSWDLGVDRSKGTNMILHYADFHSDTLEAAIQQARVSQGLETVETTESGEDSSGNTFATGNIPVGDAIFTWRISVIPLSDIYSISGLPDDAIYVGIRLTS